MSEARRAKAKVNYRLASEDKNYISDLAKSLHLFNKDGSPNESAALTRMTQDHRLLGLQTSRESASEICKFPDGTICPKYGGITEEEIVCTTKKSETDPVQIRSVSFLFAQFCSKKPFNTPLDKKTRQQFQQLQIENSLVKTERDTLRYELQRRKDTREELKRAHVEIERQRVEIKQIKEPNENLLDEKVALENDNDFKTERMKELEALVETQSHDTLIQKNQELISRIDQCENELKSAYTNHNMEIEQAKGDLEKLEALVKSLKGQKTEILQTVEKTLRDFKQFLPENSSSSDQYLNALNWKEYRQNTLKVIQNLEGYLQTVAR